MKKIITLLATIIYLNINAQLCFNPETSFSGGNFPYSVTSADFNGDNKADLAIAHQSAGSGVYVLLGTGTGSFGTLSNVLSGVGSPNSVISGDFNNDTKIDLAISFSNGTLNKVYVLLGTGTGSFNAGTGFSVGNDPISVITSDFDGDGNADLATANYYSNDISLLLGDGTGSFNTASSFTVGTNPQSIISEDFNGDTKVDLAVANFTSGNISILLGDGTGSFNPVTYVGLQGANTGPYQVISADFNIDGFADLAAASAGYNNVSILLGTGTGHFGSATNFSVTANALSLTSADFDGDSKIDLAIANGNKNTVSVLLGDNTGNFSSATDFTVGLGPQSVISVDLNGDYKTDLVTANNQANSMSALLNCNATTSVSNFLVEDKILIYPNPSSTNFTIETTNTEKQTLQVFDVKGNMVLSQYINGKTNIDATNLSEGVYNLNIITSDGIVNKRLVIVR